MHSTIPKLQRELEAAEQVRRVRGFVVPAWLWVAVAVAVWLGPWLGLWQGLWLKEEAGSAHLVCVCATIILRQANDATSMLGNAVTPDIVAEVVASSTGIPVDRLLMVRTPSPASPRPPPLLRVLMAHPWCRVWLLFR